MPAIKYKEYYQKMIDQHKTLFADFQDIHDAFVTDPVAGAEKFHTEGRKVLDVIRDWDRRLCSSMGRGKFSGYTQKLSEKFWSEVRKDFSLIDKVGVIVRKVKVD
jgi:hypothetical protein